MLRPLQLLLLLLQVGGYEEGKRAGTGLYIFPNGDHYEGEVHEDLPHGAGVYHFAASGARLEGCWAAGSCHGWCLLTLGARQIYGAPRAGELAPRCCMANPRAEQYNFR